MSTNNELVVVRNADKPQEGRLSSMIMKEVADDKPPSLRKWLQDPETHVEDTEVNSFLFHKLLSAHDMIAYHRNLLDVSQLRNHVFESKTARSEEIQILLWAKNRTVCAGGRLLSRR
jgi:hypothetical protein